MFASSLVSRLSPNDILLGMKQLGVACNENDAKLLISRYDGDQDTRLGYWEFSNMLMPMEPSLRDDLERRKTPPVEMSSETRSKLKSLFR